jgi:hypothetical protein
MIGGIMERRELVLTIRDYYQNLPEEEHYCNGCTELKTQRIHGARGQMICAFYDGTHRCDEHEIIWAIHGAKADRPLECILNGEKYTR